MIHKTVYLLIFLFPHFLHAQFDKSYIAVPILDTIPINVYTKLTQRLEEDKTHVKGYSRKINNYIKHLYEERFEYVVSNFNNDYLIDDPIITPYLQQIQEKIYKANPTLSKETTVYVYRSSVPNAFSFGDGNLAITLGLLSRLQNESQLAFILCHELAHYHRRHANMQITTLARLNYDKELEKQLERNTTYNYKKELIKNLELSINQHSRTYEFEADSIGLTYFLNTNYDLSAPVECMDILGKADKGFNQTSIDFKKYFDFAEYPFKTTWLAYEKSTTWDRNEKEDTFDDSDITHTHPNCQRRQAALKRQLQEKTNRRSAKSNETKFQHITTLSTFEEIASNYHFKEYGVALFSTLLLLEKYPENTYLHAMVSQCIYQLYMYQKNHEIGKVLDLPDSRFADNYDRFLTFFQQLRLSEIASIGYQYAESRKTKDATSEDFWYAYWLCSQLPASKTTPTKIKAEYVGIFPTGKYIASMRQQ
ncbi:M48 family metallopeptidase [Cytophagaceae bacterium DM2B3-1]|uniref:M48 family metallopeptidase n=1 Tax=Xanthocytophaga flava TaxID=3048013 RepID=A0ABT7CG44_9BACT|nr:M48 family metallopeptidase [Xanthocytophaga flavus]MDJ1492612.1 M48 family metallopeptidase [Xanthocytophaga flavus]